MTAQVQARSVTASYAVESVGTNKKMGQQVYAVRHCFAIHLALLISSATDCKVIFAQPHQMTSACVVFPRCRVANATVLYLPMAPPPNTLLCSLLFYPQNCICASTSAVLSIKKPETCVSGAFGGDNKTRTYDLYDVNVAL